MSATGQLPLSIITDDEATLANFQSRTSVLEVVNGLSTLVDCRQGEYFLWGAEGVGKSHLLQAVSHALGTHALYLPLEDLTEVPPQALLEGADTVPVLALDNVQAVLRSPDWQEALFHLFNRRRDAGLALLFSADRVPSELVTLLPDLRSRLGSLTVFHLPKQTDQELAEMLRFRAARRGLLMSDEVVNYVMTRVERSAKSLIMLLDRIDTAALAQARPVTIPLINELRLLSQD